MTYGIRPGRSRSSSLWTSAHESAGVGGYERETSSDQVSAEMAEQQRETARRSAENALRRMEQAGITSGADYERLAQVAQSGTEWGTQGALGWLGRLLGYLDRPAQMVRYGIMDIFDIGEGEKITGEAYGDILLGRRASLLARYGPEVVGEDARMGGAHMLGQIGWAEGDDWWERAARGLASFSLEVATDPISYAWAAAGAAPGPFLTRTAQRVLRDAAPEVLELAARGGSAALARGAVSRGSRLIPNLADDALTRVGGIKAARISRFIDDLPGLDDAARAELRAMGRADLERALSREQRAMLDAALEERGVLEMAVSQAADAKLDLMAPRILARDWAHPDMEDFVTFSQTPPHLRGGIHVAARPILPLPGLWKIPERSWTIPLTRGLGKKFTRGLFGKSGLVQGQEATRIRKFLETTFPEMFHVGEAIRSATDFRNYYRGIMRGTVPAHVVLGLEDRIRDITRLAGTRRSLQAVQRSLEDMVDVGVAAGWSEKQMWEVMGNLPARVLQEVPQDAAHARDLVRGVLDGALGGARHVPEEIIDGFVRFGESWRNVMDNTHSLMVQYGVVPKNARISDYFPMIYTPAGNNVIRQMARVGLVFGDTAEERMVAELVSAVRPTGGVPGKALGMAEHAKERTFGAFLDLPSRDGSTVLVNVDEFIGMVGSDPQLASEALMLAMVDTIRRGGRPSLESIDELNRKLTEGVRRILARPENKGKVLLPRGVKADDLRLLDTNPMTVGVAYLRDTHDAIVEAAAIQYLRDVGELALAERVLKGRGTAFMMQRRATDKMDVTLREMRRVVDRVEKGSAKQAAAEAKPFTIKAGGMTVSIPSRAVNRKVVAWFSSRGRLLERTAEVRAELERRVVRLEKLFADAGADADTAKVLALAGADRAEFRRLLIEAEQALEDNARVLAAEMTQAATAGGQTLGELRRQMDEVMEVLGREREQLRALTSRLSSLVREREVFETGILTTEMVLAAADQLPETLASLNRAAALMAGDPVAERIVSATGRLTVALQRGGREGLREAAADLDEAVVMLANRGAAADGAELLELAASTVRRFAYSQPERARPGLLSLADQLASSPPEHLFDLVTQAARPRIASLEKMDGLALAAKKTIEEQGWGGFSYNPWTGREFGIGDPGVVVGGVPGTKVERVLKADYLANPTGAARDMARKHRRLLERDDNLVVGCWFDEEGGVFVDIEISQIVRDPQEAWTLGILRKEKAVFAGIPGESYTLREVPVPPPEVLAAPLAPEVWMREALPEKVVADIYNAHLMGGGSASPESMLAKVTGGRPIPTLVRELEDLRAQVYAIEWVHGAREAALGGPRLMAPDLVDLGRLERGLRLLMSVPDDVQIRWGQTLIRGEDGRSVRVWGPLLRRGTGKAGISLGTLRRELNDLGFTAEHARVALLDTAHPRHADAMRLSPAAHSKLLTLPDESVAQLDEMVEQAGRVARLEVAAAGDLEEAAADVRALVDRFLPAHPEGYPRALFHLSYSPRGLRVLDTLKDASGGNAAMMKKIRQPGNRFFLLNDETAGYAVTADGEVFALFNAGPKGQGAAALRAAREQGATFAVIPRAREDLARIFGEAGFIRRAEQADGTIHLSIPQQTARQVRAAVQRNQRAAEAIAGLQDLADQGRWGVLAGRLKDPEIRRLLPADTAGVLRRTVDTRILLENPTVSRTAKEVARQSDALTRTMTNAERARVEVNNEMQRLWAEMGNPSVRAVELTMEQVGLARTVCAKYSELLHRLNAAPYITDAAEVEALKKLRDEVVKHSNALGWKRMTRAAKRFEYGVDVTAGEVLPKAYGLGGEQLVFRTARPGTAETLASLVGNMQRLGTPEGLASLAHQTRAVYSWWKGMATVVRPTFHVRNLIGGVWNNMVGFVRVRDYIWVRDKLARFRHYENQLHDTEAALLKMGKDEPILRGMLNQGVLNSSFARAEAEIITTPASLARRLNPLGREGPAFRAGGQVMTTVEDFLRAAAFKRWYEWGPEAAAEMTFALHFDYRHLAPWEHTLKKVIPFLVWTRRNVPLQLRVLVERPDLLAKYQHLLHGFNDQADVNAPYDLPIPGMFNSAFSIETGIVFNADTPFWARAILSPDLPITDLADFDPLAPSSWLRFTANMLGPQITMPFELQQQAEYGGSVNAPAGLNEVLMQLHRLGLYDEVSGDTAIMPRELRWLAESLIPPWREWAAIWETDPGRRQALGLGRERQPMSAEVLRALGIMLGKGVGLQTVTPTRAYSEFWGGTDLVREIVKNLETTGVIPRQ